MPRKKPKTFYIDTNIALDYVTNRDIQTVLAIEEIKRRGWRCVSSTFLAMEMADYQKESLFILKSLNKKWEMNKIIRERKSKQLKDSDFAAVSEWFEDFKNRFRKIEIYDFLQDDFGWQIAQDISFNSNLFAPDVIHLASAIVGAMIDVFRIFITNDNLLAKEANIILTQQKLRSTLKIMTIGEVKKQILKM